MLRALNLNCRATQSLKIVPSSDREFLNKSYFYFGNSGTCLRFLLPLIASNCKSETIIDCSYEMKLRPIKPLVDSLISIGCNISYDQTSELKYSLPLIIKPPTSFIELQGSIIFAFKKYCFLLIISYKIFLNMPF